jgi:hypothetical protein
MPGNVGGQTVTLKFYDPADSPVVNKRNRTITPVGIYSGGYLTRINDTTVQISVLVCEIQDDSGDHDQVRVETTTTVNVTVGSGTPYVVLRWTYTGVAADDFMDFQGVATPDTYDVVVGKCDYLGAVIQGFAYTERTNPNTHDLFLKVEPEQTPSMYVRVRNGYIQVGNQSVHLEDNQYGPFVAPGAGSATGAVYIDDAGAIQVSSNYTYNGQIVLAEIALTAGQTTITTDNITNVRAFLTATAIPDDITIDRDSSGKLQFKSRSVQQQASQAVGTSTATGTASWTQISNMSITITTEGGDVLVMFMATVTVSDNSRTQFRIMVDGGEVSMQEFQTGDGNRLLISMHWLAQGLSAGNHTFRVDWIRVTGSSLLQYGGTYNRVLTVVEVNVL